MTTELIVNCRNCFLKRCFPWYKHKHCDFFSNTVHQIDWLLLVIIQFRVQFGLNWLNYVYQWVFKKLKLHEPLRQVQFQLLKYSQAQIIFKLNNKNRVITYLRVVEVPEDLSWSHFFTFIQIFVIVLHHITAWLTKLLIVFPQTIIQNHDA